MILVSWANGTCGDIKPDRTLGRFQRQDITSSNPEIKLSSRLDPDHEINTKIHELS
jgi:hypothetical protein